MQANTRGTPRQPALTQQRPPAAPLSGEAQSDFPQRRMGVASQQQGAIIQQKPTLGTSGVRQTPVGGATKQAGTFEQRPPGAPQFSSGSGQNPAAGFMGVALQQQMGPSQQRPADPLVLSQLSKEPTSRQQINVQQRPPVTAMSSPGPGPMQISAFPQSSQLQSGPRVLGLQGSGRGLPVGIGQMPIDRGETHQQDEVEAPVPVPLSKMEKIAGYDKILLPNVTSIAPPARLQKQIQAAPSPEKFASCAKLSEQEARELMFRTAKSMCCWGTKAALKMEFRNIVQTTAVQYVLKTFVEKRSTDWTCEPYHGETVDGSMNGQAPYPWQILVQQPSMFQDATLESEVPHTASVRTCHGCNGSTMTRCLRCNGWGQLRCASCNGVSVRFRDAQHTKCTVCGADGTIRCRVCTGRGRVPCATCKAAGQLKYYVRLTTKFETHTKEFVIEKTPLPDELIQDLPRILLYEDTQPLLGPIQSFSEPNVNLMSAKFINEHRVLGQSCRILMQNHCIRGVPVFQCDVVWRQKPFQFFVYGADRAVYCENYPQTCCCSCELL